jgi:hypothetical protein
MSCCSPQSSGLLPKWPASGRTRRGRCRIVAGVTASQALLDAAVERGADAILVHHGYFWKGEDGRVTGIRRSAWAPAAHDINLLAYHLPLDAHPELGNNAQLARAWAGCPKGVWRAGYCLAGYAGRACRSGAELAEKIRALGRRPQLIGEAWPPVGASPGVPAARRAISSRPLRSGSMPMFLARFRSRPCIWPVKAASPISLPGTMHPV